MFQRTFSGACSHVSKNLVRGMFPTRGPFRGAAALRGPKATSHATSHATTHRVEAGQAPSSKLPTTQAADGLGRVSIQRAHTARSETRGLVKPNAQASDGKSKRRRRGTRQSLTGVRRCERLAPLSSTRLHSEKGPRVLVAKVLVARVPLAQSCRMVAPVANWQSPSGKGPCVEVTLNGDVGQGPLKRFLARGPFDGPFIAVATSL
mmetsp:Transcript_33475/g.117317  ORF Transcript_33475/g.117317 Transcript_33475/m.117317 type:complete len:206 (+) Transcript_33475:214-831(+)